MLEAMVHLSKVPGAMAALGLTMRSRLVRRSALGFGSCFDDLDLIDGEFGELFVRPMRDPRVRAGQNGLVETFDWKFIDEMEATHAKITAPVCLVWGTRDPWFPIDKARGQIGQFPGGAEWHELSGKLFVHEERPKEWATVARRFLERVAPSTASRAA
jgi:pimeloyl-ACP methyl ester carboxylesterase